MNLYREVNVMLVNLRSTLMMRKKLIQKGCIMCQGRINLTVMEIIGNWPWNHLGN